ncbi:hypothetical protein ORF 360L [Red seabream iridovirus]|nr:ORF010R [Rock bream iridovirus]AAX82319.1 ORF10R [Orange-spotted grouper iridovirus]UNA01228.1 hypothetical protein [Red seabream iridovirus]AGG37889.1 hypothetical protein [Rock bream iridovirus]UNA01343.1 hypothetical protein [Red seabream iridovirus]
MARTTTPRATPPTSIDFCLLAIICSMFLKIKTIKKNVCSVSWFVCGAAWRSDV